MRPRLTLVSAFLGIALLAPPVYGRDRPAARAAFREAREYNDWLLRRAEEERSLKHYQRAIFLYRTVVDHDPTYGACDDALFAVAGLYEEMWVRFGRERDLRRAIYYYEFVADQYPLTKHRKAARSQAEALRAPPSPRSLALDSETPSSLSRVSEVRYWSNEDYTRVVIQTEREVEFEKHILRNPDRIYFDLQKAHLDPELEGKRYPVNGLFIKQLRVGQNKPGIVRVVLDFEKINTHTVFALYDPFRIVIDTRGGHVTGEEAPIPVSADPAAAGSPPKETAELVASAGPVIPSSNLDGDRSLTRVLGLKVGRVVIDPGHGGKDTGTVAPGGLKEKDLVLSVALHLKSLLEDRLDTDVVLTRDTDRFVPLEERTAIANQLRADLFVSIHANSSRDRRISGVETFFLNFSSEQDEREVASRENAGSQRNIRDLEDLLRQIALGDFNQESQDLAHTVQSNLHSHIRMDRTTVANRGVKKAPFIVLINLNMPGILAELDFISNPKVEGYFRNQKGVERAAEGLYRGIQSYLKGLGTTLTAEIPTNPLPGSQEGAQ